MKRFICLTLVVSMAVVGLEMYRAHQQQKLADLKERLLEAQQQEQLPSPSIQWKCTIWDKGGVEYGWISP